MSNAVLLVEDNSDNITIASVIMDNEFGFAPDVCQCGEEALSRLKDKRYDLVFMDIRMPDIDGYELTRKYRAFEAEKGYSQTPIIGMTAYALSDDEEKCLQAGMNDYLAKPYTIHDLCQKIDFYLKHK